MCRYTYSHTQLRVFSLSNCSECVMEMFSIIFVQSTPKHVSNQCITMGSRVSMLEN